MARRGTIVISGDEEENLWGAKSKSHFFFSSFIQPIYIAGLMWSEVDIIPL
jgi:hypothetical protein